MSPVTLEPLEAEFDRPKTVVEHAESPVLLGTSVLTDADFDRLEIAERPALLGDWFKAGDTGFIYGKRGLGKSWLAHLMSRALAEGRKCGPWSVSRKCRVLYVDGEMAADDLRSRNKALSR